MSEELGFVMRPVGSPTGKMFHLQSEELSIIRWYVECKELLDKVRTFYREYIDIGYNDPAYNELENNYRNAYKELKKLVK